MKVLIAVLIPIGSLVLLQILCNGNAKIKGCKNCSHYWEDCVGNFNNLCEKWEGK